MRERKTTLVPAARFVGSGDAFDHILDANKLFNSMIEELLDNGDLDLAMQKAFRWGVDLEDGDNVPGLQDLARRLREDRQELLEREEKEPFPDLEQDDSETGDEVADQIELSSQMELMERSLRQVTSLDDLKGLNPGLMDATLNAAERAWIEQWANMSGELENAGLVTNAGRKLELSPQAVRRIGEYALRAIFKSLQHGVTGSHQTRKQGGIGTRAESSSAWQYGDPFAVDLSRTLMNGIMRQGPGWPVRLQPQDFDVYDRESRASAATVLMIDLSRSMFHSGCWDAAKRTALALDALIRRGYQRDTIELVGFSDRAQRLTFLELPTLEWNQYGVGTNLQHGFEMAREILRPHRGSDRQIIVVTDGEPTAFMDGTEVRFSFPPTAETFEATMREVMQCTRESITINTFLLDSTEKMSEFVNEMSRLNKGRIIESSPDTIGQYVLRDFLGQRTTRIR